MFKRYFFSKAAKLRILLKTNTSKIQSLDQKTETTMDKPKRQEWYNDPYLLSNRIKVLISKQKDGIPKAFDLVQRHAGSCTKEVYGKMVSSLAEQKKYTEILKLHNIIIRRNRSLSPYGYTAVFSAMADYASQGDWFHKSNCMQETQKIWNIVITQPEVSIQTVNALLHVCAACSHAGGYNLGWEVFEQLGNVATEESITALSKCLADHITYSMMMGICISADNEDAAKLGIQLWTNYKDLLVRKPGKAFSTVENELISKAISLCSASSEMDLGFKEIFFFFGLSKNINESRLKRKVYLSDMTAILNFCLVSENPALGLKWLKFVEEKQSSIFTYSRHSDFYRMYVKSELASKSFETAYNRIIQQEDCPVIYRLWICYYALLAHQEVDLKGNLWWTRAQESLNHPDWGSDLGQIYFYMKCGLIMKENEAVKTLLESKKDVIMRFIARKKSRKGGYIDFDDFRATIRKLMRWRFRDKPISNF